MEECYICFENKNKLFKVCKICKKEICADCINKIVKDNDIFFENNEKDIKFIIKCPNCRSNNNHNFRLNEMKMKLIMNKINKLEEENKILKNKNQPIPSYILTSKEQKKYNKYSKIYLSIDISSLL